jgi:hypothetical protein
MEMDDRHTYLAHVSPRRVGSLLALVIATPLVGAAPAAASFTELVSVRSNGKQGDGISGRAGAPSASANGRVVAFNSPATNLAPGDNNGAIDVFVRDRASGRTHIVSVDSKASRGTAPAPGRR